MRNHELRLERALQHLQSLEAEVQRWLGTNPYSLFHEFDTEGGENVIRVYFYGIVPPQFGLIVSDCIHNLRSALDNLIYDLAVAYLDISPLPEDRARLLEFPIFGKRAMTEGECRKKIGCIHPDAQAFIKELQPYQRGDNCTSDPLWVLRNLSNIDKHRVVYTTLFARSSGAFGPGDAHTNVYDVAFHSEAPGVERTAEIVRYRARPYEPSTKVHVQYGFSFDIAFGQGSPIYGELVLPTLTNLRNYLVNTVVSPLASYLT